MTAYRLGGIFVFSDIGKNSGRSLVFSLLAKGVASKDWVLGTVDGILILCQRSMREASMGF